MAAPAYVVDEDGNAVPLAGDKEGRLLLAQARIGGAMTTWILVALNVIQAAVLVYIAAQV